MKIVVISDCHGDRDIIRNIANREIDSDIYLLAGDSCLTEEEIRPFVSVKGNCDYFSTFPLEKIIKTPYGNIFIEHGHLRSRVDAKFVKDKGCFIYIFGHTHRHYLKKIDDVYFVNPGSTSRPRDDTNGTYLIININEDKVDFDFKTL